MGLVKLKQYICYLKNFVELNVKYVLGECWQCGCHLVIMSHVSYRPSCGPYTMLVCCWGELEE